MILIDHQNINLPNGVREFGPVDVEPDVNTFTIRLARNTPATSNLWPDPLTAINAEIYLSYDGGLTWPRLAIAFTATGGQAVGRDGNPAPESYATGVDTAQPGRKIKAIVTVENGPLRSQITVETA